MSSTAVGVFRNKFYDLVEAIDSPTDFANDFYREGLISKSARDAAAEVGNTRLKEDKATQLLSVVQTSVKVDPKRISRVIRVLRRHVPTEHLGNELASQGDLYPTE